MSTDQRKHKLNSVQSANRFAAKHFAKIVLARIEKGEMEIPIDWAVEKRLVKGKRIISGECPWEGEIPEGGFDPEKDYVVTEPVALAHNVERRLYRALKKGHDHFFKYMNDLGFELVKKEEES